MGPAPLGFAYFVGVKFAGYTAAAFVIRKAYPAFKGGTVKVGAARTAIGLVAGLAYGAAWILLSSRVFRTQDPTFAYLLGLLPVRIAEWLLLLHLFFDRNLSDRKRAIKSAVGGSIWSYCLDAIGIGAALVIPGGIWVC
jgi:hypothetical protein